MQIIILTYDLGIHVGSQGDHGPFTSHMKIVVPFILYPVLHSNVTEDRYPYGVKNII